MTHEELLEEITAYERRTCNSAQDDSTCVSLHPLAKALRAVVELIQEKQKFLEETKGDIPMTNQQLGAREERTKLLAEIIQAIEKELG